MALQKKRMLLFGPGYGHNVERCLQRLNETSLFNVVFFAYHFDEELREKHPTIDFVPFSFIASKKYPWQTLKSIINLKKQVNSYGRFDVVYSLGVEGLMAYFMFRFANNDAKKATEIWSVHLLESAKRNCSIWDKLNKSVIDKVDFVCQNWWGIRDLFVKLFPKYEDKFLMFQLTFPDIYFSSEKHIPESAFVKEFLAGIPKNQIVCFWPRSFIPSNNHALLLEALGIIEKSMPNLLTNFKLYLWGGNVQNENSRQIIENCIINYSLKQYVEIVDHPFVPQNDIFAIEERSDFFVQIANDDILSTYIMEILCSGKPFVISNLRTFQFLNEKYDLKIDFVENDAKIIAKRIQTILTNLKEGQFELTYWRREKCKAFFSKSNTKPSFQILYEKL